MKRIFALIISVFMLCAAVFLVSCDYQDTVDSARENLMDTTKDLLDPFLNQAKSSTVDQDATDVQSSQDDDRQDINK